MQPDHPSVLAVLVVRDGARWLTRSLAALARQRYSRLGIVAVDNASTDGSRDMLERLLGSRRVVRLTRNEGFAAAVGRAMELDAAAQADFLLLVHDDAVLAPDAVERLVEGASRVEQAGIVGPKVLDLEDRERLQEVGLTADRFGYLYSPLEEGEIDQGQYQTPREVLYLSGTAMLVSREAWQRVGPPDERLGPSHGDLDFCWRVRLAGFRVLVEPSARVFHHAAGDRGERPPASPAEGRYLNERSALTAMLKNYRLLTLLWVVPLHAAQGIVKVLLFLLLRRFADARHVVAGWGWALGHLGGTVRRRVRSQNARRVPDRAVTRFMAPAASRVRRWLGQASAGMLGSRVAPVDLDEEPEVAPISVRVGGLLRDHPVAVALSLGLIVWAIAFRDVVLASPFEGGSLPALPPGASDLLGAFGRGWSPATLRATVTVSPALVPLGIASALTLGSPRILLWLLVSATPFLAATTAYRAIVRGGARTAAGVASGACYALSAVVLWAVSEGHLGAMVFVAALPWLAARVAEPFDAPVERPLRFAAGSAIGLALVGSFYPAAGLPLAIVTLLAVVIGAREGRRMLGLGLFVVTIAGAAVLVFPLTLVLVSAGGEAPPSVARSFAEVLRLSPGPAPGSWFPALFLPVAGVLALALVDAPDRRRALRAALAAGGALVLAWLAAAGRLPGPAAHPVAFLALAAWSASSLVGMALRTAIAGAARHAFGTRQLAIGAMVAVVGGGLALQAIDAAGGGWAVGQRKLPPAWPVVATANPGVPFRVLWLGDPRGGAFPPPGGLPEGVVEAGPLSVRYAVTGRRGTAASALGLPAAGPGYDRLETAIGAMLSGGVRHGGSLLAPLGIAFVVVGEGDLPEAASVRLDSQLDLLATQRAGGLVVYRSTRALPLAGAVAREGFLASARSTDPLAAAAVNTEEAVPFTWSGRWLGRVDAEEPGAAVVATSFDRRWRIEPGGAEPFRAFGWAVGFPIEPGGSERRLAFHPGPQHAAELALLAVLWAATIWFAGRRGRVPSR